MPVHECVRAYVCSMYLAVKKPQKIKKLLVSFMKDEVRQSCSMAIKNHNTVVVPISLSFVYSKALSLSRGRIGLESLVSKDSKSTYVTYAYFTRWGRHNRPPADQRDL